MLLHADLQLSAGVKHQPVVAHGYSCMAEAAFPMCVCDAASALC